MSQDIIVGVPELGTPTLSINPPVEKKPEQESVPPTDPKPENPSTKQGE